MQHYHESITRSMYEPERGYIGFSGDFIDNLTNSAERIAQGAGRVRDAYADPREPAKPAGSIPTGVWVLVGIGGLLIAFGAGRRK